MFWGATELRILFMRRAQAEDELLVDSECKIAARKFIERFGEDAPHQATIRAAELQAARQAQEIARKPRRARAPDTRGPPTTISIYV